MSTHNICFYGEIMKFITKLSPNTLLICSTVTCILLAEEQMLKMGIIVLDEPHHEKTCLLGLQPG